MGEGIFHMGDLQGLEELLLEASKYEKALVDYLYLVGRKVYAVNTRLDISSLNKEKMHCYTELFRSANLERMIKELYD